MARGKQLHPHTGGSKSFAIKRDKFIRQASLHVHCTLVVHCYIRSALFGHAD